MTVKAHERGESGGAAVLDAAVDAKIEGRRAQRRDQLPVGDGHPGALKLREGAPRGGAITHQVAKRALGDARNLLSPLERLEPGGADDAGDGLSEVHKCNNSAGIRTKSTLTGKSVRIPALDRGAYTPPDLPP